MNIFFSLVMPHGLVLFAVSLYLSIGAKPAALSLIVSIYPLVVLVVGFLLGWRFNKSNLVFALLVLALAERGIFYLPRIHEAHEIMRHVAFFAISLVLPINFIVLSMLTERGIFTVKGLWRIGLMLLQVPLIAFIAYSHPEKVVAFLNYTLLRPRVLYCTPIPQAALIAIGLGLAFFLIRFLHNRNPIASGFFWALLAVTIALSQNKGQFVTIYFATAGLILVISIVETAYTMVYQDELTTLPGRRALKDYLLKLGTQYTIAMLDIDHFKKFNDTHGHDVGDQVLRMVASKLAAVSGGGRAFRYGGEEFTLIFSEKSLTETTPHLEALRETIETSRFTLRGRKRPRKKPKSFIPLVGERKKLSVTVSIGVAEHDDNKKADQVIKAADKALYRAKKSGRNRVST